MIGHGSRTVPAEIAERLLQQGVELPPPACTLVHPQYTEQGKAVVYEIRPKSDEHPGFVSIIRGPLRSIQAASTYQEIDAVERFLAMKGTGPLLQDLGFVAVRSTGNPDASWVAAAWPNGISFVRRARDSGFPLAASDWPLGVDLVQILSKHRTLPVHVGNASEPDPNGRNNHEVTFHFIAQAIFAQCVELSQMIFDKADQLAEDLEMGVPGAEQACHDFGGQYDTFVDTRVFDLISRGLDTSLDKWTLQACVNLFPRLTPQNVFDRIRETIRGGPLEKYHNIR